MNLRRYSKAGLERRKEKRQGYSEFFMKHVGTIKSTRACCQECGCRLMGDVSEVAHILDKSFFNSVSLFDSNVIYLCSWKSSENCHAKFDSSNEQLQSMRVFSQAQQTAKDLLDNHVTEKYNYKKTDRWLI